MMKSVLITLFTLLLYVSAQGQNIESIRGNVVDQSGAPCFGNAIALSTADSSVIKGVPFFEGHFELDNIKHREVLLRLNSLTFKDTLILVSYQGDGNVSLGEIIVSEASQQLDEVVVVGKSPMIVERPDGSVAITVANTALATSTSVEEILGKSPGIVVDENSTASVFGRGEAIIFINGIRVSNDRLSTLSPSLIESIEIITNPGPRYDAEGNAVINIITNREVDEGAKGIVKNYFSYSDFGGYQNRTDLNYSYSKNKWIVNSNYAYLRGEHRHILETTRVRDIEREYFKSDLKTDRHFDLDGESNYGIGLQYSISKQHYLSLQYSGASEKLGGEQFSTNSIFYDVSGQYNSTLKYDERTVKDNISVNYYVELDTAGSDLFIGTQYAVYNHKFDNDIDQENIIGQVTTHDLINNAGAGNTQIMSFQADYASALPWQIAMEAGMKLSKATINSNTEFFNLDKGYFIKNETLSNDFAYKEIIPAAYFNLKGNLTKNIAYSVGLRSEYTYYTLNSSVDRRSKIGDEYLNIFPSASINRNWADEFFLYLTYSSRIIRAPYERLNPFVTYQDAFTSIQGNPDLRPSIVSTVEWGGTYKGWNLKTSYSYTKDPMDGGAFQSEDDPKTYILQRTNLSKGYLYSTSVSKNVNLPWWRSVNTATLSYSNLVDNASRYGVGDNRPYYYLYSQNSFDIARSFTFYFTGWYLSRKRDGVSHEFDLSSINLGFEKKMLKDKLKVNLDLNDIFHQVRYDGEYTLGLTDIVYFNTMNTNYVRLSLTYNFGKLKDLRYNNKNVGEEETQRAQ